MQAMRNVPGRFHADQFQRLLHDDRGSYAIDIVVAMNFNRLVQRNCRFDARHCAIHIAQQERVMQIFQPRVQEFRSTPGIAETTFPKYLNVQARCKRNSCRQRGNSLNHPCQETSSGLVIGVEAAEAIFGITASNSSRQASA